MSPASRKIGVGELANRGKGHDSIIRFCAGKSRMPEQQPCD
jgi:hypothetical protein